MDERRPPEEFPPDDHGSTPTPVTDREPTSGLLTAAGAAIGITEPRDIAPDTREDIDAARIEAGYEDELRTKAVANRDVERPPQEKVRIEAIDAELSGDAEVGPIRRWRLGREREGLEETYKNSTYVRSVRRADDNERTGRQFDQDFPGVANGDNFYRTSAKARGDYYDEQAARVGDWAGILKAHPLSTEFKRAHPDMKFQPETFVRMEDEVMDIEEEVRQLATYMRVGNSLMAGSLDDVILGKSARLRDQEEYEDTQQLLRLAGDEALQQEWDGIQEAVIGEGGIGDQLDELRRKLTGVKITNLQNRAALIRNFLAELHSEIGLQADEPAAPEAAADDSAAQPPA